MKEDETLPIRFVGEAEWNLLVSPDYDDYSDYTPDDPLMISMYYQLLSSTEDEDKALQRFWENYFGDAYIHDEPAIPATWEDTIKTINKAFKEGYFA